MDDAVAVALEGVARPAIGAIVFRVEPASAPRWIGRERRACHGRPVSAPGWTGCRDVRGASSLALRLWPERAWDGPVVVGGAAAALVRVARRVGCAPAVRGRAEWMAASVAVSLSSRARSGRSGCAQCSCRRTRRSGPSGRGTRSVVGCAPVAGGESAGVGRAVRPERARRHPAVGDLALWRRRARAVRAAGRSAWVSRARLEDDARRLQPIDRLAGIALPGDRATMRAGRAGRYSPARRARCRTGRSAGDWCCGRRRSRRCGCRSKRAPGRGPGDIGRQARRAASHGRSGPSVGLRRHCGRPWRATVRCAPWPR